MGAEGTDSAHSSPSIHSTVKSYFPSCSCAGSQVIFRVRRPAYLISSTMFVEDGAGTVIGEIHQRWNLLKRNYDLYINKSQFAAISGMWVDGTARVVEIFVRKEPFCLYLVAPVEKLYVVTHCRVWVFVIFFWLPSQHFAANFAARFGK